jgi:hypothetical protein
VIERPRNVAYFRGHVAGKIGVKPAADIRLAIHRASDRDGNVLPMEADPRLMVLHYESPDGGEFVRKWRALLDSGAELGHGRGRSVTATAIQGLLATGLTEAEAAPYFARIYERTRLDDFETLRDLRLLERHDPDSWQREPEPFPRGAERAWRQAVAEMRAEPKGRRHDVVRDSA